MAHALLIVSLSAQLGVALAADGQETGASPPRPKICVVAPDVQVGQGVNAEIDLAGAVAKSLVSYLSGPVADVVPLKSRVVVQINAEATQQGCTHVVDTSVTHRHGSALKKKLLAAVPGLASTIPMLGGAASSMAAAVAAEGLVAMQYDDDLDDDWMDDMRSVSQVNIKKGDVITLKFDLRRPTETEPMATSQLETRAAANGEDILSPLLEKTATQVLSVILGATTTGEVRSHFETAGGNVSAPNPQESAPETPQGVDRRSLADDTSASVEDGTEAPVQMALNNGSDKEHASSAAERQLRVVPTDSDLKKLPPAVLASLITTEQPFEDARRVVNEVLARGGLDITVDGSSRIAAYAPRASLPVTTVEVVKMVLEQQAHGSSHTSTVEELAQLLTYLGWPFADSRQAGKELQRIFATWLQAARERPDALQSFAPLFIQASMNEGPRRIDLAATDVDPGEVRLTLLEIELFLAASERLLVRENPHSGGERVALTGNFRKTRASEPAAAQLASLSPLVALTSMVPAKAGGPCSDIGEKVYGSLGWDKKSPARQATDFAFDSANEEAIKKAFEAAGYTADQISVAIGATKVASQLMKAVGLYKNLPITVTASREWIHKPQLKTEFKNERSLLGVGPTVDFKATLQMPKIPEGSGGGPVRDCLASAGLVDLREAAVQVAEVISQFAVEWRLTKGSPEHVEEAPVKDQPNATSYKKVSDVKHLGHVRTGLTSAPDGSLTSSFKVRVRPEDSANHPSLITWEPAVACAEVDTTTPPQVISTIANVVLGGPVGLTTSIAELVIGMLQKMMKPEACGLLKVHLCERYSVVLTEITTVRQCDGGRCDDYKLGRKGVISINRHQDEIFIGEGVLERTLEGTTKYVSGASAPTSLRGDGSSPVPTQIIGGPGEKERTAEIFWTWGKSDTPVVYKGWGWKAGGFGPVTLKGGNWLGLEGQFCADKNCKGFTIPVYPNSKLVWPLDAGIAKSETTVELRGR